MLGDTGQSQAVSLLHTVFILAQSKLLAPLFRVLPIVRTTAEGHFMLKSNLHLSEEQKFSSDEFELFWKT